MRRAPQLLRQLAGAALGRVPGAAWNRAADCSQLCAYAFESVSASQDCAAACAFATCSVFWACAGTATNMTAAAMMPSMRFIGLSVSS